MKTAIFLSFVAFAHQDISVEPLLPYDPLTTKDCIEWQNVLDSSVDTCESVLRYWSMNPSIFHAWNPSVGLDCQPWLNMTSYCILTNERMNNSVFTTNSDGYTVAVMTTDKDGWRIPITKSGATTTTTTPLGPTPTAWTERGCYVDNTSQHILDMRFGTISDLNISTCKDRCYRAGYEFAGVQNGDQCWCSTQIDGERAEDQKECNVVCSGNEKEICGGEERLNIFQAEGNKGAASNAGTGITSGASATGTGTSTAGTGASTAGNPIAETATASSGARRNVVLFWGK